MLVKDEPSPPFACKVTIWPVLERMYFLPSYFFKSLNTLRTNPMVWLREGKLCMPVKDRSIVYLLNHKSHIYGGVSFFQNILQQKVWQLCLKVCLNPSLWTLRLHIFNLSKYLCHFRLKYCRFRSRMMWALPSKVNCVDSKLARWFQGVCVSNSSQSFVMWPERVKKSE